MRKERQKETSTDAGRSPAKKAESLYVRYFRNRTVVLHPTVLVCVTYLLLLLSKLVSIPLLNRENEYYSIVILQMMIFLLPGAVWCKFSGENYLSELRFRPFRATALPLIFSAALLIASGGLLLGVLFGGTDTLAQSFSLYDTFVSRDTGTVPSKIYLILAYALIPAICEEFIFRGILCREYEVGGVPRAVVFSALFFALLHFNLANLPVYLFSGVILALTLYATRSLFGAMLAHFLYNIFGLFGQPYINNLYHITGSMKLFLFLMILCFLVSAGVFCGEAARLYRSYLWRAYSADYRKPVAEDPTALRRSYLNVIKKPSAIACFAVYIIALVIGFLT